jgi:hypothetical protein
MATADDSRRERATANLGQAMRCPDDNQMYTTQAWQRYAAMKFLQTFIQSNPRETSV